MSYPVARGTPMIQSLIEWDHSIEWAVADFSKKVDLNIFNYVKIKPNNKYYIDNINCYLVLNHTNIINCRSLDPENLSLKLI